MITVNWTRTAVSDLERIRDYLVEESPKYAAELYVKIIDNTEKQKYGFFVNC